MKNQKKVKAKTNAVKPTTVEASKSEDIYLVPMVSLIRDFLAQRKQTKQIVDYFETLEQLPLAELEVEPFHFDSPLEAYAAGEPLCKIENGYLLRIPVDKSHVFVYKTDSKHFHVAYAKIVFQES